jgi:hypothetical protein
MARNEWLMDDGGPDAAVLVVVQVAPADSNRRDLDEGLVEPAFAEIDWRDPDIGVAPARRRPGSWYFPPGFGS